MTISLISLLGLKMGANELPYSIPIHPQLVHLTLGLLIIAILFDIAGTLFPLGRFIFKFLAVPTVRASFYEVGWYNLLAATIVTFLTVTAGFFELMLATPPVGKVSNWGLDANTTMLLHGLGGILLLAVFAGITVWRGLQRYRWRKNHAREVQWSYLFVGVIVMGVLYLHGTLGAQLGDEFGIHNTAVHELNQRELQNIR